MTEDSTGQVAIWDTSAVNKLADREDRDALIVAMKIAHQHWIPFYIFEEIAATQSSERRSPLLGVCRNLIGSTGRILWSPVPLIQGALGLFAEFGEVDMEVVLRSVPEFEREISLGTVFDDDLARVQWEETKQRLQSVEDFFQQMKVPYENYCRSRLDHPMRLDAFIAQCLTDGLPQRSIRDLCSALLGRAVDLHYSEKFAAAFLQINSIISDYLVAHYYRSQTTPTPSPAWPRPAGPFDLHAAAYLPVCDLFISDDRKQQEALRGVAERNQTQGRVFWFEDYVKTFSVFS